MNEAALQPAVLTFADVARMMRESGAERSTWIYFIQAGADGPIKIGSSRTPRERLAHLQTASPVELHLRALWRAFPLEEKQLHDQFAAGRIRSEWFEPTPELLQMVEAFAPGVDEAGL